MRWPHCQPCPDQPERDQQGRIVFRARQCPWTRWVRQGDSNKWLCDLCGRFINDERHFISSEHTKQLANTQLPPGQALGFPDPQLFIKGGHLWDLTRGASEDELKSGDGTADVPRKRYNGWVWTIEYRDDGKGGPPTPIDIATYPTDWQWVPKCSPGAYDDDSWQPPSGVVASNDDARDPWDKGGGGSWAGAAGQAAQDLTNRMLLRGSGVAASVPVDEPDPQRPDLTGRRASPGPAAAGPADGAPELALASPIAAVSRAHAMARRAQQMFHKRWFEAGTKQDNFPLIGLAPGAPMLGEKWPQQMHRHYKTLRKVFFTEFYDALNPEDDGSRKARDELAKKHTCAIDARVLALADPEPDAAWYMDEWDLWPLVKDQQEGTSDYYLVLWQESWTIDWSPKDVDQTLTLMVSKKGPLDDHLADFTVLWPPSPGGPGPDGYTYPDAALVHHASKKKGIFHADEDTVAFPDAPGAPYYRLDLALNQHQYNKVTGAMREFFLADCDKAAMWGTGLPILPHLLATVGDDTGPKEDALSVAQQCQAADRLRAQAHATLAEDVPDNTAGLLGCTYNGWEEAALTDDVAEKAPGCLFQRILPAPPLDHIDTVCDAWHARPCQRELMHKNLDSLIVLCQGPPGTGKSHTAALGIACYLGYLPDGWGIGVGGGTNGSMDNLADHVQRGPGMSDYYPSGCLRLAHEDRASSPAASAITPVQKYTDAWGTHPFAGANTEHQAWFGKYKVDLIASAKLILATHESMADLKAKKFLLFMLDEAGQTSEPHALMSLVQAVRSLSRLLIFGDDQQLSPTVKSTRAASWGLGVSILAKLRASIGDCSACNVMLNECFRIHPSILAFPTTQYYDARLRTAILDPLRERPCFPGPLWRAARRLPDDVLDSMRDGPLDADTFDSTGGMLSKGAYVEGDNARLAMIHVPGQEATSDHHEGYTNLLEAATILDVVGTCADWALEHNHTIMILSPYKLMLAALILGNPASPDDLKKCLRYLKATEAESTKGKGGKAKGKGKVMSRVREVDGKATYRPDPTRANALDLAFEGARARFAELLDRGLLTIMTIDASQGREADLVILSTVRANPVHSLGHLDDQHRINVGITRARSNLLITANLPILTGATDSGLNVLVDWCVKAELASQVHIGPDGSLSLVPLPANLIGSCIPDTSTDADKERLRLELDRQKRDKEVLKARKVQEAGFKARVLQPLPEDHSWTDTADTLNAALARVLTCLALAPCLLWALGLHPHEYGATNQPLDPSNMDRKGWSMTGFLFSLLLGLDAGNMVYTATMAALFFAIGLGSSFAEHLQVPNEELPPRPQRPGMSKAWFQNEACIPPGTLRSRPFSWSPTTCACRRHLAPPSEAVFRKFCDLAGKARTTTVAHRLTAATGMAMDQVQRRVLLALSLLTHREPRTCMYPYGDAEGLGDVLEAVLGIACPSRPLERKAQAKLGLVFGLKDKHFRELHGALQCLIQAVSDVTCTAHHHEVARAASCPKTWAELEDSKFPLQATLLTLEALIPPADTSALADSQCSVCDLYMDVIGDDEGLGPGDPGGDTRVAYVGGGYSFSGHQLQAPAPLGPSPGTRLAPPYLDERDTRLTAPADQADHYCQGCLRGAFSNNGGAYTDCDVRKSLATNRHTMWLGGYDISWWCLGCWQIHFIATRSPPPEDVVDNAGLLTWIRTDKDDPSRHLSRPKPQGVPVEFPGRDAPLAQLLIPMAGETDPHTAGTTLPSLTTGDDRLGARLASSAAAGGGMLTLKCDYCPEATPATAWRLGDPVPGMFVFGARPERLPAGVELVHGLPPYIHMKAQVMGKNWNGAYSCEECLVYLWNMAPKAVRHVLNRDGPAVFPKPGERPVPLARSRRVVPTIPDREDTKRRQESWEATLADSRNALLKHAMTTAANPAQQRARDAAIAAAIRSAQALAGGAAGPEPQPEQGSVAPKAATPGPSAAPPAERPTKVRRMANPLDVHLAPQAPGAWCPAIAPCPPPVPPNCGSGRVDGLTRPLLVALVWHLRHLGFWVDQTYRAFLDEYEDPETYSKLTTYCPTSVPTDALKQFLATLWPGGKIPASGLPELPHLDYDGIQYRLGHIVFWLVNHGGHGDAWDRFTRSQNLQVTHPPLVHKQLLRRFVLEAGSAEYDRCPYLTETLWPHNAPGGLHEPIDVITIDRATAANALGAFVLPEPGPPQGPALADRRTRHLASEGSVPPGLPGPGLLPRLVQHQVISHFRLLHLAFDRQWVDWVDTTAPVTDQRSVKVRYEPRAWDAASCADFLSQTYGDEVPHDFMPGGQGGAIGRREWDGRRAALAHACSFLIADPDDGGQGLAAEWGRLIRRKITLLGPDPLSHPRPTLEAFLVYVGATTVGQAPLVAYQPRELLPSWDDVYATEQPTGTGKVSDPAPPSQAAGSSMSSTGGAEWKAPGLPPSEWRPSLPPVPPAAAHAGGDPALPRPSLATAAKSPGPKPGLPTAGRPPAPTTPPLPPDGRTAPPAPPPGPSAKDQRRAGWQPAERPGTTWQHRGDAPNVQQGDLILIRDDVKGQGPGWRTRCEGGELLEVRPRQGAIVGPVEDMVMGEDYLSVSIEGDWLDIWDAMSKCHIAHVVPRASFLGRQAARGLGLAPDLTLPKPSTGVAAAAALGAQSGAAAHSGAGRAKAGRVKDEDGPKDGTKDEELNWDGEPEPPPLGPVQQGDEAAASRPAEAVVERDPGPGGSGGSDRGDPRSAPDPAAEGVRRSRSPGQQGSPSHGDGGDAAWSRQGWWSRSGSSSWTGGWEHYQSGARGSGWHSWDDDGTRHGSQQAATHETGWRRRDRDAVEWGRRPSEDPRKHLARLKSDAGYMFCAAWHTWCYRSESEQGLDPYYTRVNPQEWSHGEIEAFLESWSRAGRSISRWQDQNVRVDWEREERDKRARDLRLGKGQGGKGKRKDGDRGRDAGRGGHTGHDNRSVRGRYGAY